MFSLKTMRLKLELWMGITKGDITRGQMSKICIAGGKKRSWGAATPEEVKMFSGGQWAGLRVEINVIFWAKKKKRSSMLTPGFSIG